MKSPSVWPALEETRYVPLVSAWRAVQPIEPTVPVGAYAAYLAWLDADAQAAVAVGLSWESR